MQLLGNGTDLLLGHIQVHDAGYLPDRELHGTIGGRAGADWPGLLAELRRDPRVRQAVPRVYGSALLSTGDKSSGAQLVGIDPAGERTLSRIMTDEVAASLARSGSVAVGELLALETGVAVGDEVAVVTQAFDGTLGSALFRVRSIVRTGIPNLDRSLALVRLEDATALLALPPGRIHEIAIRIVDPMDAPALARELTGVTGLPAGAEAWSWRELLPQLSSYVQLVDGVSVLIVLLVVLFASMGVLNTMLMATYERVREFGMLNAIGMSPAAIVRTVLVESLFMVVVGLTIGVALGWLMMQRLTTGGIPLDWWMKEIAMLGSRLDPVARAAWNWGLIPWAAAGLALAAVAASYWPARRATRVDPVEALRAPVMPG